MVPGLDDTFVVMNGDLLTNLDFHALVRFHRKTEGGADHRHPTSRKVNKSIWVSDV